MAGGIRLQVQVEGYRELRRKLRGNDLLADPWRDAMKRIGEIGVTAARPSAPRGRTGQLAAKLTSRIQARPMPKWAAVRTTATRSSAKYRRYSYPKRLEFDPGSRHKGWLRGAINRAWGRIEAMLDRTAREIERAWRT